MMTIFPSFETFPRKMNTNIWPTDSPENTVGQGCDKEVPFDGGVYVPRIGKDHQTRWINLGKGSGSWGSSNNWASDFSPDLVEQFLFRSFIYDSRSSCIYVGLYKTHLGGLIFGASQRLKSKTSETQIESSWSCLRSSIHFTKKYPQVSSTKNRVSLGFWKLPGSFESTNERSWTSRLTRLGIWRNINMGSLKMPKRCSSWMEFEYMKLQNDILKDLAHFPQGFFHGCLPLERGCISETRGPPREDDRDLCAQSSGPCNLLSRDCCQITTWIDLAMVSRSIYISTFPSLLWTSTFEKICLRASGRMVLHVSDHAFTQRPYRIAASFASSEMMDDVEWNLDLETCIMITKLCDGGFKICEGLEKSLQE